MTSILSLCLNQIYMDTSISNNSTSNGSVISTNNAKKVSREDFSLHELDWGHLKKPLDLFLSAGIELPTPLKQARESRQLEFLAGRYCVKMAMSSLSLPYPNEGLAVDDTRAPRWPEALTGAITHKGSYAAALICRHSMVGGIGLDREKWIASASNSFAKHIVHPDEYSDLESALKWPREAILTLIFSAKESVYKALFPMVKHYFGFHSVTLNVSLSSTTPRLTARLTKDLGSLPSGFCLPLAYRRDEKGILTLTVAKAPKAITIDGLLHDTGEMTRILNQLTENYSINSKVQ